MRDIDMIVVHCTDTPPSRDIGAAEIRDWHVRDNGWSDIGYHYVIRRDGTVEFGRPLGVPGAHAKGFNDSTIGICLVGGRGGVFDFTFEQVFAFRNKVALLRQMFPGIAVRGHRELNPNKTCPGFHPRWLV